jgi:hypothetical protein
MMSVHSIFFKFLSFIILALVMTFNSTISHAEDVAQGSEEEMAEIAQKLNNPVSSLINFPMQNNFDFGGGPSDDGFQYKLNVQPVVPLNLNENWKVISRTIIPFIHQEDRIGTSSQTGLSDINQSFFFSPQKPGAFIWGLGPVLLFPTATDDLLGTEKWGVGPTGLILKQEHGWTYGALVNHIWSFAGDDDRSDVDQTFLQPFLNYTTTRHTTFGLNMESTYDWEIEEWTVPVNAFVTQLVKINTMPVSFTMGGRYYADKPTGGPDWGLRFVVTLVF